MPVCHDLSDDFHAATRSCRNLVLAGIVGGVEH